MSQKFRALSFVKAYYLCTLVTFSKFGTKITTQTKIIKTLLRKNFMLKYQEKCEFNVQKRNYIVR